MSMEKEDRESLPQIPSEDDSPTPRCCFHFPCFATEHRRWWTTPFKPFRKLREWSEIVAGPKWKTFIRRLNRSKGGCKPGNFQYDPLSYALNFDEGVDEEHGYYPDFASRYVSCPLASKSSTDLLTPVAAAAG